MDDVEVSCVFYVSIRMFTYLEQSKISLLTANDMAIGMLIVQHDLIANVSFMYYSRDHWRQASTHVLYFVQYPIYI
jgi:hypothetical protein